MIHAGSFARHACTGDLSNYTVSTWRVLGDTALTGLAVLVIAGGVAAFAMPGLNAALGGVGGIVFVCAGGVVSNGGILVGVLLKMPPSANLNSALSYSDSEKIATNLNFELQTETEKTFASKSAAKKSESTPTVFSLKLVILPHTIKFISHAGVEVDIREIKVVGSQNELGIYALKDNGTYKGYAILNCNPHPTHLQFFMEISRDQRTPVSVNFSSAIQSAIINFIVKNRPDPRYCCVDFVMDCFGLFSMDKMNYLHGFWEIKDLDETALIPGDCVFWLDKDDKPQHYAIYFGQGLYLSVLGQSALTLMDMNNLCKLYTGPKVMQACLTTPDAFANGALYVSCDGQSKDHPLLQYQKGVIYQYNLS